MIMKNNCKKIFLIFTLFFLLPCPVFAIDIPDAGKLIEGIGKKPIVPLDDQSLQITIDILPDVMPSDKLPKEKIEVKGWKITGNTIFEENVLKSQIPESLDKSLSLSDMMDVSKAITRYYRDKDYTLVYAYIPSQDIKDGIVEIAVLEGKFGKIDIQKDNSVRLRDEVINSVVKNSMKEGDIIQKKNIEKGLLLTKDLNNTGIETKATVKPGAEVGTADLILQLQEASPLSVDTTVDNYGSRYTGYYRAGATVTENDLSGWGESISVNGVHSDGLDYVKASASLPVGGWGSRLGAAYSAMSYDLGKEFDDLDANGNAYAQSAYFLHPLIRSREFNLYLHIQYDHKTSEDNIDLAEWKKDLTINALTCSFFVNGKDNIYGGGSYNVTATGYSGDLSIDTPEAKIEDAETAQTDGSFSKVTLNAWRLQKLTDSFSGYLSLNGQYNVGSRNLDSSEKFSIGGPLSVRSYPQGEAMSDSAYVLTGELRYDLNQLFKEKIPGEIQLVGFVDYGAGRINEDTWPGAGEDNTRELSAGGLGLNWKMTHFTLKTSYALKLGSEDTTSDTDKDGCFWILASMNF
ncbi:MAG: ShlB/FhaC/HecB family hemolysin secretion/activation protein [Desulfobacula sp.]|jgi:hemolysin activation/secretion protein